MISKDAIANRYRELVKARGGKVLSERAFHRESGISTFAWHGCYWPKWSAFQAGLGFEPGKPRTKYSEDFLLRRLAELSLEMKKIPNCAEMRLHRKKDPTFPHTNTYARLGPRHVVLRKLSVYCHGREGIAPVSHMLDRDPAMRVARRRQWDWVQGLVYLARRGDQYELGRERAAGRRLRQMATRLSALPDIVHVIDTDDPEGIERYWRSRFRSKGLGRRSFRLSHQEINAFRRRRYQ